VGLQQTARQDRDREMRRLLGFAAARDQPGLQRRKMEPVGLVGSRPAKGRKVLAGGWIGLPQLDRGVGHRIAVTVENRSGQHDTLAPNHVRSAHSGCSIKCQKGPIVWLLVAAGMLSPPSA
jgi:hypothetical protein